MRICGTNSKAFAFFILLFFFGGVGSGFAQDNSVTGSGPAQDNPTEGESPETRENVANREKPKIEFGLDLGIGAHTFNDEFPPVTYQSLSLSPNLTIGKFQAALDLTLHFNFTGGEENDQFTVREEDWVPDGPEDILPTYLPKIRYIQWASKGEPLFIRLGQIQNATLGNGFIMSGYTNTLFLPEKPIVGLVYDMDGELFSFPYLGIETMIANLGVFDVLGGRFYVRPFSGTEIPVVKGIELGTTLAGDRKPFYYAEKSDYNNDGVEDSGSVLIAGGDINIPIFTFPVFTLSTFGDIVFENQAEGGMVGLGGTILEAIPYRGEIRIIGDNFIPVYFDTTYDLYRPLQYTIFAGEKTVPGYIGWLGSTGLSLFDDKLGFSVTIDGPFTQPEPENSDNFNNYPHFRGTVYLRQGLIPVVGISFFYDKRYLRKFSDFGSPEGTFLGTNLSLKIGPALITLTHGMRYNTNSAKAKKWETTSGIQSTISLF